MDPSRGRIALGCLLALVLSACGTTVPLADRQQQTGTAAGTGTGSGSGLDGDQAAAPAQPGSAAAPPAAGLPGAAASGTTTDPVAGAPQAPAAAGPTTAATAAPGTGARPTAAAVAPAGRVTGPVVVGFTVEAGNGQQANSQAGVSTGQSVTVGSVYRGLVKALNREGGLAGRRIEPVYHELDPSAADYQSAYAAACADFTQDHKAVAVLSTIGYDGAFQHCLESAGAFHVTGEAGNADEATLSRLRGLMSVAGPALERRERAIVSTGQELRSFARGTVVGVIVDGCPETRIGYTKGLVPAASKAGLKLVRAEVRCTGGYADLGSLAASLQNAVLRFRSEGATQVTFVSNVESTEVILFATAAENQGYRPGYVLSSRAQPVALALNLPAAQLKNMAGAGWQTALDAATDRQPPRTAAQDRCLKLLRSQGVTPKGSADLFIAYVGCDTVFAYERVLRDTGGRTGLADVATAAGRIGTTLLPVGSLGTDYRPGALDGPAVRRGFRYDTGCSCFGYVGDPKPMT